MKLCINCRHAVSQGAPVGRRGQHRSRRRRVVRDDVPSRGAAVAGTGKPSASSKATGKGK